MAAPDNWLATETADAPSNWLATEPSNPPPKPSLLNRIGQAIDYGASLGTADPSKSSFVGAGVRGYLQGRTGDWGDEIGSALASAIPFNDKTNAEYLAESRASNKQAAKDHPLVYNALKMLGAGQTGAALLGGMGPAAAGALAGGVSSAGESEGGLAEKAKAGLWGAGVSAILGHFLGNATNRYVDQAQERAMATKSVTELAAEKKAIIEKLQSAPPGDQFQPMMNRISEIDNAMGRTQESKGGIGLGKASLVAAVTGHPMLAATGIATKVADYGATQMLAKVTEAARNGSLTAQDAMDAIKAGVPASIIQEIAPSLAQVVRAATNQ